MATLKELSERTGYSPATISRILNGDHTLSVPEEVRRKVLEEAGKTNYTENRSRRGRPPKSMLRVGIAEMLTPVQQLNDPYYLYLGNYVKQGCLDRRYTCVPLENRGEVFVLPRGKQLDGIVAIGYFTTSQIESLISINPNIVFVDSSPRESTHDSVVLGYGLGIRLAVEHLQSLNHQKIGYVGRLYIYRDRRKDDLEIRCQAFVQLMESHGLYDPDLMIDTVMDIDATIEAWKHHLEAGKPMPSAVVCANEESAIGTLKYLQQEGYTIPGDVAVVSFNDTPRSALVSPPLTSVSINTKEMANAALRMLAERIAMSGKPPVREIPAKLVVPPTLVVRESTT